MFMERAIARVWAIFSHPAFWLPLLTALGIDLYIHGLRFDERMIGSDGWGYYLPLPAIFVFGDPYLVFLHRSDLPGELLQYRFSDGTWQGLSVHGSGYLDKYVFGPAVMQLPFFLIARKASAITSSDRLMIKASCDTDANWDTVIGSKSVVNRSARPR